MSVTLSTMVRPAVTRRASAFSRLFNTCRDGIARYFVRRADIATLRELDDRALRDIGIARCQIEGAVHGLITRPDQEVMVAAPAAPCAAIGSRRDAHRSTAIAETFAWS